MDTATPGIGISRIGQIAINVHDLKRATAFYRDTLGLRLLFTAGKLAFFDCGGVRLMLDTPEKPGFDHPSSILYFAVTDIKAAHQQMVAQGVRFEDEHACNRENARPRFMDDLLSRLGAESARADERGGPCGVVSGRGGIRKMNKASE
jgi:methylmalonyl-CoA/ethylmalonyl-CoA epimerase